MPREIAPGPHRVGGPSRLWPDTVETIDALPPSLQTLVASTLADEPALVLFLVRWDSQRARWWRESIIPSRLIALTERRLIVFRGDEDGNLGEVWEAPLARLLTVEWGQILRYSWLRFTAGDRVGLSETKVLYNSVGGHRAWQLLARLMSAVVKGGPAGRETEGLGLTESLPLKFQNAIRHDLFPGDRLLAVAHQPFQTARLHHLFRRERFPESVLAVTARYVLLLREGKPAMWQSDRYGTIATYVPLSRVRHIGIEAMDEMNETAMVRLELAVGVGETTADLHQPFSSEVLPELEAVVARIGKSLVESAGIRLINLTQTPA